MPLLENPKILSLTGQKESLRKFRKEAKKIVINGLDIPNPQDWETREGDAWRVSYTCGSKEYEGYPQPAFFPTDETTQNVADELLRKIHELGQPIERISMEAWHNTTFMTYEPGENENQQIIPGTIREEVGSHIESPNLTIYLAPRFRRQSGGSKERGPAYEQDPYQSIAIELMNNLAETLGLREDQPKQARVVITDHADTPISVEFDCEPVEGYLISEELRMEAAKRIIKSLKTNPLTKKFSGEVWIRQGHPKVITARR